MGLRAALPVPSPNLQIQEVGAPVEMSLKVMACPAPGAVGEKVNAAFGGASLMVTLAVADLVVSAAAMALIVTISGVGTAKGAL